MPFLSRLVFAWVCFFRVIFDGAFAARAHLVREAPPELPPGTGPAAPAKLGSRPQKTEPMDAPVSGLPAAAAAGSTAAGVAETSTAVASVSERPAAVVTDSSSALLLLALLQREGRLIDFVQEDLAAAADADIGIAARVVHEGCRKALKTYLDIVPIRSESEDAAIQLPSDFDANAIKLTGKVSGSGPYSGVLRHAGWRAQNVRLPHAVPDHDAHILAPAEVAL